MIVEKLRDYQHAPYFHLLDRFRKNENALVDWSDTGTGKSYVAAAVAKMLNIGCLVVPPKIATTQWHRVAEHFDDELSVCNYESLRTGHTPYGKWENQTKVDGGREEYLVCEICQQKITDQPCYAHPSGVHCAEIKKKPIRYGDFLFNPAVKMLVFDEAHRCNGTDSLNSELMIAARRQGIKTLCLSATAAVAPIQMRALGFLLDLHCLDIRGLIRPGRTAHLKTFEGWLASHGYRRDPAYHGWLWRKSADDQKQIMAGIRAQIIPDRGVRITTDQIPGFPECDISAELYDLENKNEIDKSYGEMSEAIRELDQRTVSDKDPDHPLTKILRARQRIELCKVPVAVEIARDKIEQGFSVGLFVNFRQTIEEISKRLRCPIIDGTVTGEERKRIIDDFQINKEKAIVIQSDTGGICISLQDFDGRYPRFGIVMPSFSATTMIQLFGRFPREGGKSKSHYRVLLAANTIETSIFRSFNAKRNNIGALTDGDLMPEGIQINTGSKVSAFC